MANDESNTLKIQNLIVTLIQLCTIEEQKEIMGNLETMPKCVKEDFITKIDTIKQQISV